MARPTADTVSAAVRAHQSLGLRSENHKAYGALFVDIGQLHVFDTPDWQVVYGRRGTGKTFLLRVLEQRLRAGVEVSRVLPIYIDANDLLASPISDSTARDDERRGFAYFQIFLECLMAEVARMSRELMGRPSFTQTLKGDTVRTKASVDRVIARLLERATSGAPVDAYLTTDYSANTESKKQQSRGLGVGASAKLSPTVQSVKIEGRIAGGTSAEYDRTTATERSGPTVYRLDHVRADLSELAGLLRIERLVILIDEWSALDRSTSTIIQPLFGSLLRRALGKNSLISVKVATSRYQTRFAGRVDEPAGLELNNDIFVALNLDRAALPEEQLEAFYAQVLFKRLLLKEPRMIA